MPIQPSEVAELASRCEDPGGSIGGHPKASRRICRPIRQPEGLSQDESGDAGLVRAVSGKEGNILNESVRRQPSHIHPVVHAARNQRAQCQQLGSPSYAHLSKSVLYVHRLF